MAIRPFRYKLMRNCSPFWKNKFDRSPSMITPWCLLDPRRKKLSSSNKISRTRNWRNPSSLEEAKFLKWSNRPNKAKMLFWKTR